MAKLIIQPGTPHASEFELKPGSNYLGRSPASDLMLADPSVSNSHAQIILGDNVVIIRDLGSTNGTYVNRSQIKEGYLQTGQLLRIGSVELRFEETLVISIKPARP